VDATYGVGESWARRTSGKLGETPVDGEIPFRTGHELYGALDLGTNNCRLLIARPGRIGFTVVDAFSRIVRLGEGLSSTGRLGDAAMTRTIAALRVCANKLAWRKVGRMRLIATEACRAAENGMDFIARVKDEIGLSLEVIDRETEARLAATGAQPLIDPKASSSLVFDIGGGSTELMWLVSNKENHQIKSWTSLRAGVVTISERFGGVDVTPEAFEAMRISLRPMLAEFAGTITNEAAVEARPAHLLGTSGTVTTIAGVQLGLKRYDRSRVDGCWLTSADIGQVTQRLLGMSYDERQRHPCIGRERADLVLAGCAILEEIRHAFPTPRIRVADRGLREGMLTQMMRDDGTYGRPQ
jgi:exopolyphosphatase/guanosine-5'-triphosphate,3'-diphosphate pyrophosphatase